MVESVRSEVDVIPDFVRRGLPSPQKDSELVVDADIRSCRMCIAYIRLTVDCGHWGIGIRGYI